MPYYVRPMLREDIPQVAEIDSEAFPTMLPPPNFERELRNKMTGYLVVCDEEKSPEPQNMVYKPEKNSGLLSKLKLFFIPDGLSDNDLVLTTGQYINGYVGYWVMGDEAHITTIAVRESLRRQGIGELLIISALNQAMEAKVDTVTLEVRVTNTDAQRLYEKYGFRRVGVRKSYYTDNREDGLLMTTDDIASASFQSQFKQLQQAHTRRWGAAVYRVSG